MKIITLLCVAVVISTGAFAQKATTNTGPIKSGIMKKGKTVWMVKPMQDNETMDNGLKITPNGRIHTASGQISELNDGDCVSPDGRLVGLNEKNLTTAYIKHDRMWIATRLDKPLTLKNGTSILPDGTLKKKDGSVMPLKNDEILDITNAQ
jgi:hypothetical protein